MRATEFILETEESIITYLVLCGHNLTELEKLSADIISGYLAGEILWTDADESLHKINKQLRDIIAHPDIWGRFKDDPEWKNAYLRFSKLYQKNIDAMSNTKGNK